MNWLEKIKKARKHEKKWRNRAEKIIERYRDEQERSGSQFNILWANTETLRPTLYSATPKADIRRRFKDRDPVSRLSAETLERCTQFQIEQYDFDDFANEIVTDFLLPGRSVDRVRYVPTFAATEIRVRVFGTPVLDSKGQEVGAKYELDGEDVTEEVDFDDEGGFVIRSEEELVYEEVRCEHVLKDDFAMDVARRWQDVDWVAFRHRMTRKEMVEQFGAIAGEVPITIDGDETSENDAPDKNTAEVWEVWDKKTRKVIYVADGYHGTLSEKEDPLGLEGFFPIPKPLYAVRTNGSLVPVPEFTLYQDQADELNEITFRINNLVEALRVRGAYPGSQESTLSRLLQEDENALIPVEDWQGFAEKGGLENMISWLPIEQIGKTLAHLYQKRAELLDTIYQLTGISDIQRGATDPRETARAQALKSQFGSQRLVPKRRDFQKYIRDILKLKAEIIAEKFQPETIRQIAGLEELREDEIFMQVIELLRDDTLRNYRIDIETDSTVAADEKQAKEDVVEFFNAVGTFIQRAAPLSQIPGGQQAALEMLLFGVRRFKTGRTLEDTLEALGQQQPQQQNQPNPEVMKAQAEIQRENQELQTELQLKQQELQAEIQRKDRETAAKIELMRREFQQEQQRKNALNQAKVSNANRN